MKRCLTRALFAKPWERHTLRPARPLRRALHWAARRLLDPLRLELVRVQRSEPEAFLESTYLASQRSEDAETMIGIRQLDQMQACIQDVLVRGIPGDLLEAGVWRGGMTIFMRAALRAWSDVKRRVWVVDSFRGLPEPAAAQDSFGWAAGEMSASFDEVRANFTRYGLLDDQVVFLKGFFEDTLPHAPLPALAVLRVDADLYESTRAVLTHLYPRLSVGGYAIFDDYRNLPDCRRAIDEYRSSQGITEPIVGIDRHAVFWRKSR